MLLALLLAGCVASADAPPPPDPPPTDPVERLAFDMKQRGGPSFTVVMQPPWVVAGDGAPADVLRRAQRTVAWSHAALVQEYEFTDPAAPVAVWMFRDDASYVRHVEAWHGETPSTPYGFAQDDGLYMNIDTGGGTLIHEMVHPLLATNVPTCPPWFNEGLASLYEATGERDGRIVGLLNWRLPGLQQHLRAGTAPAFGDLMSMDADAFYGDDSGVHYAASRYLLYYLQEQGLLQAFYKELKVDLARGATGLPALQRVLGRTDVAAFQAEWSTWVLALEA